MAENTPTDPHHRNSEAMPPGTPNAAENTCRRCSGSGRIRESECPDCGGTGKMVTPVGGAG